MRLSDPESETQAALQLSYSFLDTVLVEEREAFWKLESFGLIQTRKKNQWVKIYEFINRSRNSLGVSKAAIHKNVSTLSVQFFCTKDESHG